MTASPKRNRSAKLKKVNISKREQWRSILKEVDKNEIPVTLLLSITVNLIDGTRVNIDIDELLNQVEDPKLIEDMLDVRFKALDAIIKDIDFYVNIDHVAKIVQPITDEILKKL